MKVPPQNLEFLGFAPPERKLNVFNAGDLPVRVVPTTDQSAVELRGLSSGVKASIEMNENDGVEHITIFGSATDEKQWPPGVRPYLEVQINESDELSLTTPKSAIVEPGVTATVRIAIVEGNTVEVKERLGRISFLAIFSDFDKPVSGEIKLAGYTYQPGTAVSQIWDDYGDDVRSVRLELDERFRLNVIACNDHTLQGGPIRVEPSVRDIGLA